ncbi:MAG: divalent-cation tolerance protein CutA [Polyangiaceae bacterium]|nr:divalent-cation tolerance protein CutA [Polyangiaceae bacterium]
MNRTQLALLYVTFDSEEEARLLSRKMVELRLAACANIFPATKSIYEWQGKLQEVSESVVVLKTRRELVAPLREALQREHSYDTPACLDIRVESAGENFLDWVHQQTAS